jgi:hypothetical protein
MFQTQGMKNIKKILSYSFSNFDIKKLLGQDCKIMEYNDLIDYNTIDDLLPGENNYVVILIETSDNVGHWCCLLKYKNTLEWFDSYALGVDEELSFIRKTMNKILGQDKKQLTKLIDESPYECIYNNIPLQSHKSFISTCGRWVCSRVLQFKKGKNLKEYIEYLEYFIQQNQLKGPLKYDMLIIKDIPYVPI